MKSVRIFSTTGAVPNAGFFYFYVDRLAVILVRPTVELSAVGRRAT